MLVRTIGLRRMACISEQRELSSDSTAGQGRGAYNVAPGLIVEHRIVLRNYGTFGGLSEQYFRIAVRV
jgi:hypothetical protein